MARRSRIDLNHVSQQKLAQDLDIGDAQARKIINFRRRNGKIVEPSELTKAGISRQHYNRIRHRVFCGEVETHGKMSRQTYRRHHEDKIEDIKRTTGNNPDTCHIISANQGGADHEHNFILAGASFNRRLQDKGDDLMCAIAAEREGIDKVRKAIRASRLQNDCTLTVDDAERLVKQGEKKFRQYQQQRGCDEWDAGESYEGLDGSKFYDPQYCEWVIQIWLSGCEAEKTEI